MKKVLSFIIICGLIILSCKKDNSSSDDTSAGGGISDKDWTISTSSTFVMKDSLGKVYVQDNNADETFLTTVTLSKLPNRNNPNLKGEFQFVIDYEGKTNLNISQPISFSQSDFGSNETVEKKVSILIPGENSKIGTIRMKMRERLNEEWTAYKYAEKEYTTAYAKATTPTIEGPDYFENEAIFKVLHAEKVILENADKIATLTKISDTEWKITKEGLAYGTISIKATNKDNVSTSKEVVIGVPLPEITGPDQIDNEATYTIVNAATVVLENNNNIATLTKVSETSWKVNKIGTAYGKVTIKATNKAGTVVKKEVTVGTPPLPAPTISGSTTVCQEEIYTIKNATNVTLENASGIATLTSLGNDQWKVSSIGSGDVILKAINNINKVSTVKNVKIVESNYELIFLGYEIDTSIPTTPLGRDNVVYSYRVMNNKKELSNNEIIAWGISSDNALIRVEVVRGQNTPHIFFTIKGDITKTTLINIEVLIDSSCGPYTLSTQNFLN